MALWAIAFSTLIEEKTKKKNLDSLQICLILMCFTVCVLYLLKRQDDPLKLYVTIYFSHRTDESMCNVPTLLRSLVLTSLDPWWAPRIASWVYQSIWRKLSWYHPVQPPCSFVLRLKVPEKGSHHLSVMSELLLSTGTENSTKVKKMKSELAAPTTLLTYLSTLFL